MCPDFYRAVVIVSDLTNHKSYKRIRKLLKKEIDCQASIDFSGDPRLKAWDAPKIRIFTRKISAIHQIASFKDKRQPGTSIY